jgi:chromosome segregation ATPase
VRKLQAAVTDHGRTLAAVESEVAEVQQQQSSLASTVQQHSAELGNVAVSLARIEGRLSKKADAVKSVQQQLSTDQVFAVERLVDMQYSTLLAARKEELSSRREKIELLEEEVQQLKREINVQVQLTAQQQYIREMLLQLFNTTASA